MLGKRLKQLRGKRTQQEIADRLTGISRASYCHYENGYVEPSINTLCELANLYAVSLDFLVGREE